MRTNWNTKIIGESIILVPYHQNHVDKYHQWMKSQELQVNKQRRVHCTIGYANLGNNENFHLLHFAVHQTNDRE